MANANGWDALSDPTRRSVLEALRRGPLSVADIARGMTVTRPAVSQHLKTLKEAGLVRSTPRGTRNIYEVEFSGMAAMRSWLDRFWEDALLRFKAEAERTGRSSSPSPRKKRKK